MTVGLFGLLFALVLSPGRRGDICTAKLNG
jgi:hypothetical protein